MKEHVLKCTTCKITYFCTVLIRLHLLLKGLIRVVGYEEARNGTDPETLLKEVYLAVITQARKIHEISLCPMPLAYGSPTWTD